MKQVNSRKDAVTSFDGTPSTYFTNISFAVAQTIANATNTLLSFSTETEDGLNCFDLASPTKLTFPRLTYCHLDMSIHWSEVSGVGDRSLVVLQDGVIITGDSMDAATISQTASNCMVDIKANAGSVITFQVWQNSGGNLNVTVGNMYVIGFYLP